MVSPVQLSDATVTRTTDEAGGPYARATQDWDTALQKRTNPSGWAAVHVTPHSILIPLPCLLTFLAISILVFLGI